MKLNALKNKKGSALLWVILMTIIITILLGAVLAATYAYFNYTMYTVKRQQAYFTARSAISVCLEEFTSVEQEKQADGSYKDSEISILPERGQSIDISDFGFDENMGTASAHITRSDDDEVVVKVTSKYADEEYTMKATVVRQPLYFGGVAIKSLSGTGKLTLATGTDFYWNNTEKYAIPSSRITINGNFVSKGDAKIAKDTIVAGHKFNKDADLVDGARKIWNANEYVISSKTLTVSDDDNTEYTTTTLNTLNRLTDTHAKYCNNTYANSFGTKLGNSTLGKAYNEILRLIGLGDVKGDIDNSNLSFTYDGDDATAIQYIEILSASNLISNELDKASKTARIGKNAIKLAKNLFETINNQPLDTLDISYVDFASTDGNTRRDHVIPLTYMFLRGGDATGTKVRVKYGCKPGNRSKIGQTITRISDDVEGFVADLFDINNDASYTVVYLEKNTIIHLGYPDPSDAVNRTNKNLIFLYSIYGGEGTKVVLHDGVKVFGEIICDELQVEGDVEVAYTSTNGSQVAKQKIAEFWTVCNYSD